MDTARFAPDELPRRVPAVYRRIAEADRPEVWNFLRPQEEVLAEAEGVAARARAGERLPLAGALLAVKDNVDVAGMVTTAGCPAYGYLPETSATAVRRLVAAGAVVLGKTAMDQFATGLAGTRTAGAPVRAAGRPDRVAGGSSAGSAVAVALGFADLAVGTDTAGSGRVPAAFNGIVGLKPTLGLMPKTGVVPASPSYDCLSVFARTLAEGQLALEAMTGQDSADPRSRSWPEAVRLSAGERPRLAVPDDAALAPLSADARRRFQSTVDTLRAAGVVVATVDLRPFLAAGALLYDGALVAERYAAVGEFIERHRDQVDPVVAGIILAAGELPAHRLSADQARLDELRAETAAALAPFDALLVPTAAGHPSIAEVEADPVGVPKRTGGYASFANPLDLAAVAVPAGTADGGPFGVTVLTRAFDDQIAIDVAALLTGEQAAHPYPAPGIDLIVFGARLRGQPLNGQLVELGARFLGEARTAEQYRMVALPSAPPVPGVLRAADGSSLVGERWRIAPAGLGRFLARLRAPMSMGAIELADGDTVIGFQCDSVAAAAAMDITGHGGWRAYLGYLSATGSTE
ncbi:allophanate hydrolase [Amycolatopsis nigrescens]|uniref:allophanate hydrolase n=1 Tax=Amycolatopsis nigrescens TaxID=381445 RepID=UPI000377F6E6|nr:allophanate hydrolase [Amycolatopsis nigrescens]